MAKRMTGQEVWNVKLLICKGYSQIEAARAIGISGAQVSRICLGDIHRNIEWPNPAVGERLMRDRRTREGELSGWSPVGVPEAVVTQDIMDRGGVSPPERLPSAVQVAEATEAEAIEQARQQVAARIEMKKEIDRRVELIEKEEEAEFIESMQPKGPRSTKEVERMPTAWEVPFLEWEEVLKRASNNDLVKGILASIEELPEQNTDQRMKRAVGIVFYKLPEREWEGEQVIRMVIAVAEQLEGAKR